MIRTNKVILYIYRGRGGILMVFYPQKEKKSYEYRFLFLIFMKVRKMDMDDDDIYILHFLPISLYCPPLFPQAKFLFSSAE